MSNERTYPLKFRPKGFVAKSFDTRDEAASFNRGVECQVGRFFGPDWHDVTTDAQWRDLNRQMDEAENAWREKCQQSYRGGLR